MEVVDPAEVLATRMNPESKKIHEWENSSEDLMTDNLIKKKSKKELEQERKEEQALMESMHQSNKSLGGMSEKSKARSKAKSSVRGGKKDRNKKFLSSESEDLEELPPALRVQRQCQNVVVGGYQYIVDLFGTQKKEKTTGKKAKKAKKGKKDNKSGTDNDGRSQAKDNISVKKGGKKKKK